MNKDTLQFLQDLAANNNKEWMDANKKCYQDVRKGFLDTVGEILGELGQMEPGFLSLRPKDCIFRQNRDIRFSANKDPYKNNMGAYFAIGGKKSTGPGYYLHVQPGECFLGGGIWMPPSDVLKKIRQEIDYSGAELESIVKEKPFQEAFGEIRGEKLKTSPRDYPSDHPYVEFLRMKSFVVSKSLSDEEVMSGSLIPTCIKYYKLMGRFNGFLSRALEDVEGGEGIL